MINLKLEQEIKKIIYYKDLLIAITLKRHFIELY